MSVFEGTVSEPIQENNPPAVCEPIQENTSSELPEKNMEPTVKSKKSTLNVIVENCKPSKPALSIVKKPSKDSKTISRRAHFLNDSNHYDPTPRWNRQKHRQLSMRPVNKSIVSF